MIKCIWVFQCDIVSCCFDSFPATYNLLPDRLPDSCRWGSESSTSLVTHWNKIALRSLPVALRLPAIWSRSCPLKRVTRRRTHTQTVSVKLIKQSETHVKNASKHTCDLMLHVSKPSIGTLCNYCTFFLHKYHRSALQNCQNANKDRMLIQPEACVMFRFSEDRNVTCKYLWAAHLGQRTSYFSRQPLRQEEH